MAKYSTIKHVYLYSAEELAQHLKRTRRAIAKATNRSGVYFEWHQVKYPSGVKATKFYDVRTTIYCSEISSELLIPAGTQTQVPAADTCSNFSEGPGGTGSNRFKSPTATAETHNLYRDLNGSDGTWSEFHQLSHCDLNSARSRFELLQPILALPAGDRGQAVTEVAKQEGVAKRTVYRWLSQFDKKGIKALLRDQREDRGRLRIPQDTYHLIVQALISNTASTSTKIIYRTLLRAVPEAMQYERGGKVRNVSISTVQRVKHRLLNDPYTRLLFYDADKRKEHLRTYAGEVFAAHANHLWQMDMTCCDVMVCDVETGKVFRPRIHAIIDVYSGCIPGWALSLEEDQTQTDLALLRALVPKPTPYTDAWPVFGTPQRLYWDNDKTYGSDHARRMLAQLGIEVIYSKPRVSHTRGKIERSFGTFHSYEMTLPGYVGKDAKERSTEELRRITKNTKRWLERGMTHDPGWGNRLLTLTEYQERVMDWLLVEYHHWVVHDKTRLEHFLETVPLRTQALYSREELMLVLARQATRVVNPDGSIRLSNRYWTVESGELINYVAREVVVLTNQFAAGEEHLIAWREPSGRLRIIGSAIPMPKRADSEEARQQRIASQAQARRAQRQAKELKEELTNPNLVVSKVLREHAQAELDITPLPQPELPRARLAAVNPKDPVEELDPHSEFDRHFLNPLAELGDGPRDPKERIKWLRERRGRKP